MIAWFTRNGVAANLLMALMVVGGVASLVNLKRELFPQFSLDMVTVSVPYLGAAPEEVEEAVIIRIEEAIEGIDGIKEVQSTAAEGFGTVIAEIQKGYDLAKVKDQIKSRVDAITTFPEETERPIIDEVLIDRDVIWISIFGDTDEKSLKEIAQRARDEIVELPGISQVEIRGVRDYELSIEVSEAALRKHNLTFDQVMQTVRLASIDLPGGLIRADGGEIQVRTKEQNYRGVEFAEIVLLNSPTAGKVYLSDVAEIKDGFAEQSIRTRFNGKPASMILVQEVGRENPLDISKSVYQYVEEAKKQWIPDGVEIAAWGDSSFYLQGRLDLLVNNGLIGFGLVLLSLALFLRPSLAFFVAMGIPVSFLGTFLLAPFIGLSINLISLFAFILVLGIVVDDAIVVGESVFSEYQRSGPSVESAIRGTHLVSTPVMFAVFTTMVAFLPVFFLPGLLGKFFVSIPMVVIPTLAFSLVQSKLVLPYHLSLCKVGDKKNREKLDPLSKFQRFFSDSLESFIQKRYRPLIRWVVEYRYLTGAIFVGVLLMSFGLVISGLIRFVQFPNVPSDFIMVELKMAEGTTAAQTEEALTKIDDALEFIAREIESETGFHPIKHVGIFTGFSTFSGGPNVAASTSGSNIGSIIVELAKSEIRDASAFEVSERWREKTGQIAGARRLVFEASAAGPVGLPINIRLTGRDFDQLKEASLAIQERVKQFEGIFDVRDTYSEGKREIKIRLKDNAEALGVTTFDIARQVRSAFYGAEAQRIQRGKHDVRVMVRYPRGERESLGNLENMRIRTADGREIPIYEVAELEMGTGYPFISRIDRKRVINIQADADKEVANTTDINNKLYKEILPELLKDFPGVVPVKDGEAKEWEELLPVLIGGVIMVLVMIYTLLAVPFKSYVQPAIVILVVPFGISGAFLGHFFTGQDLSTLSFLGIIALSGVVVNDSLVLVDYINRLRAEGVPLLEAVMRGGVARFRPILLTSITTFVGLIPILMERSLQAQFLIPMATSLSFGVLFATFITLLLVPCVYLMLEDVMAIIRAMFMPWINMLRPKHDR